MSKLMKTTTLTALLSRITGEYLAKDSIYEIPGAVFRKAFALEGDSPGMSIMSGKASLPVGPAAGPHSQIAPNLVAAYLAGARVFELKTVQENDRLDIEKPCIDALDEGHNVEWSTELTLDEARQEYLNGWIAINLLAQIFSRKPSDFVFNMSVGYTLEGIRGAKVDAYIEGMRRPENTPYWQQAMAELAAFVRREDFRKAFGEPAADKAAKLAQHLPARPVHSVTLSTMHGCPPDEIERIGRYLIEEKGFDCYVKLNPTLVGYDAARGILDSLGWHDIVLKRESFEHDLQMGQALSLIRALQKSAEEKGCRFGIKLSNTLANVNDEAYLPGKERYMSGRALFPITVHLAAMLAKALPDFASRFSYCGGVSALNAADLINAGMGPLTIATDILKPGGYLRMAQVAEEVANALSGAPERPDAAALQALAQAALARPEYRREWKSGEASIEGALPMFDCFAAPCVQACPVNQKVPGYLKAIAQGEKEQALATILADNPLPHITGVLCDHVCQEHCSRVDYEGSVRIRDVKLACARACELPAAKVAPTGKGRTAVVGAGPAGLACAHHLALAGHRVTVFDRATEPGGVPAHVIPRFRIDRADIAADIGRIEALGAEFRFGTPVASMDELKSQGFDTVFIGSGAHVTREMELTGSGTRTMHALEFLSACGEQAARGEIGASCDDDRFAGVQHVVVAGGGNTACDAVRAATRIPGVQSVRLAYRRTRREMPADLEELGNALAEAGALNAAHAGTQDDPRGVLLELSLPERLEPGAIVVRAMKLGEKDASGRRAPVKSDETFTLPCDLLVTAVGELPDRAFLESFGIEVAKNGLPVCDHETMETRVAGLYVGGDARTGPASIIAAEAEGRRAARAILARSGKSFPVADHVPPAMNPAKLAQRGVVKAALDPSDPGFIQREGERCLACDSACLRCVEVCPNRANMFIAAVAPFAQSAQILHVDRLCNECGNCGRFCPWEGEPYRHKPTLFDSLSDLEASENPGFAFVAAGGHGAEVGASAPSLLVRAARSGKPVSLAHAAWNGASSDPALAPMIALARAVWRRNRYLVEVQ